MGISIGRMLRSAKFKHGESARSDYVRACDEVFNGPLIVVDIGAHGGAKEPPGLAPLCNFHAFEPRRDSYERLASEIDASRAYGCIRFHRYGVRAESGPTPVVRDS